MKSFRIRPLVFVFVAFLVAPIVSERSAPAIAEREIQEGLLSNGQARNGFEVDADSFVDARVLDVETAKAVARARTLKEPCAGALGGVVNHHALAADLLADFFVELARCRPDAERVIILAPDHYHQGNAPVVTAPIRYRVFGDELETDASAVTKLLETVPGAREHAKPFKDEHGIGALVPFLHRALPEARVIPVLVEGRATHGSVKAVADWIASEMKNPKTLAIASSDMSHYLTDSRARENDHETLRAFATNNGDFFWRADDDFADNGKSVWAMLHALGTMHWRLQKTAISTEYGGSSANTTSYITGYWIRNPSGSF